MLTQAPPGGDPFFPPPFVPGDPFSTPALVFFDSVRVFDQVFGGAVILGLVLLLFKTAMTSRRVYMIGIVFLVVSAVGTEFEALGTPATYRLLFNTVGILLCAVATGFAFQRGDP